MIKYQIAAINNYWEKCYEHLGTNGRTEVKQYSTPPPFQWSGIDITEEGSDVGDDSDDEDFEPSLNFTLRFVMLISYVSVVTYILEMLS
jgi:hypothetical protein